MKLSLLYEAVSDPEISRLLKIINSTGVDYTLVGGHSLSQYIPRRPSKDVDIVANNWEPIVKAVMAAFPELKIEKSRVAVHLTRVNEEGEEEDFLDIIVPRGGNELYKQALGKKSAQNIEFLGVSSKIPTIERLAVFKVAAMISPFRASNQITKDAIDFIRLVKNHPDMDQKLLRSLGDRIYPGGGQEVLKKFKAALDHPDPPFSV